MKGNRPLEHHFAVRRPWLTAFVAATYERRGRFSSASDTDRMSGCGPRLLTLALQQVDSYLRHTGRGANSLRKAVREVTLIHRHRAEYGQQLFCSAARRGRWTAQEDDPFGTANTPRSGLARI